MNFNTAVKFEAVSENGTQPVSISPRYQVDIDLDSVTMDDAVIDDDFAIAKEMVKLAAFDLAEAEKGGDEQVIAGKRRAYVAAMQERRACYSRLLDFMSGVANITEHGEPVHIKDLATTEAQRIIEAFSVQKAEASNPND